MPAKSQLGAKISPSFPPGGRQGQALLAPSSSGALARLLPRGQYPTHPRLSSAPGNLGWKENKPLGSETAACGEPEPGSAASVSGGGSTRLAHAQHGHHCTASCELPSSPLSSAASGALGCDTRLLPGTGEHHVPVLVPIPAQTLQLHQGAMAGPSSPCRDSSLGPAQAVAGTWLCPSGLHAWSLVPCRWCRRAQLGHIWLMPSTPPVLPWAPSEVPCSHLTWPQPCPPRCAAHLGSITFS